MWRRTHAHTYSQFTQFFCFVFIWSLCCQTHIPFSPPLSLPVSLLPSSHHSHSLCHLIHLSNYSMFTCINILEYRLARLWFLMSSIFWNSFCSSPVCVCVALSVADCFPIALLLSFVLSLAKTLQKTFVVLCPMSGCDRKCFWQFSSPRTGRPARLSLLNWLKFVRILTEFVFCLQKSWPTTLFNLANCSTAGLWWIPTRASHAASGSSPFATSPVCRPFSTRPNICWTDVMWVFSFSLRFPAWIYSIALNRLLIGFNRLLIGFYTAFNQFSDWPERVQKSKQKQKGQRIQNSRRRTATRHNGSVFERTLPQIWKRTLMPVWGGGMESFFNDFIPPHTGNGSGHHVRPGEEEDTW